MATANDGLSIRVNNHPEKPITLDEFEKEYANFLINAAYLKIGIADEQLTPTNFYKIDHFDDRILENDGGEKLKKYRENVINSLLKVNFQFGHKPIKEFLNQQKEALQSDRSFFVKETRNGVSNESEIQKREDKRMSTERENIEFKNEYKKALGQEFTKGHAKEFPEKIIIKDYDNMQPSWQKMSMRLEAIAELKMNQNCPEQIKNFLTDKEGKIEKAMASMDDKTIDNFVKKEHQKLDNNFQEMKKERGLEL
ncbi:hypothetical protein P8917_09940 [Bacillus atrophaeus]|uniref:hypothetical protein n=1 Tax=Bacillus atrophaeus TaxID=1452 RepID=UPI00227EBA6C|nr:hypothetical protein [Bacillus atrophaeus]MCY8497764.1 hypothetical protein [Bacillus atrophaeus]MCY8814931.1 hypothetical protein [Bacillus atrophaeus]MCY8821567.1 hypothetical protein [Bacillus atrophaeus]MCY8830997.1 hypothetical protein [Bacillus atrophaeus]MCY8835212.1 hypothetical protein [Bacillus atrophaeus]